MLVMQMSSVRLKIPLSFLLLCLLSVGASRRIRRKALVPRETDNMNSSDDPNRNVGADDAGNTAAVEHALWKVHAANHNVLFDNRDYRADASSYLQEALQHDHSGKSRCDLPRMRLSEVQLRWEQAKQQYSLIEGGSGKTSQQQTEIAARTQFNSGLANGLPVIVDDVVGELKWPAAHRWTQPQMISRLQNKPIDFESFSYSPWSNESSWLHSLSAPQQSLGQYLASEESGHNVFFFVSEDGKETSEDDSGVLNELRHDFIPHPSFAYPPDDRQAIFAIDGIGSSHGFHSHDPVWQVQVEGYKMWHLMPPTSPCTERTEDGRPEYGSAVLVDGQPFKHPNACAMLKQVDPPPGALSCLVAPGEMVLLPTAWFHATCGLSNYTAAAGGWLGKNH